MKNLLFVMLLLPWMAACTTTSNLTPEQRAAVNERLMEVLLAEVALFNADEFDPIRFGPKAMRALRLSCLVGEIHLIANAVTPEDFERLEQVQIACDLAMVIAAPAAPLETPIPEEKPAS